MALHDYLDPLSVAAAAVSRLTWTERRPWARYRAPYRRAEDLARDLLQDLEDMSRVKLHSNTHRAESITRLLPQLADIALAEWLNSEDPPAPSDDPNWNERARHRKQLQELVARKLNPTLINRVAILWQSVSVVPWAFSDRRSSFRRWRSSDVRW